MIDRTTLGGSAVTIHAPAPGELDPFADHPLGDFTGRSAHLWGLDMESNALEDAGAFGDGFVVRTVQLAPTDDVVFVLRMDDPLQRAVAGEVLADPANVFVSHTKIDPHAVWVELGIDLADRFIDSQVLAVTAAPNDIKGQAGLKDVAKRFGMPELAAGEVELDELFDRLYRAAHPKIGKRAVKAITLKAWGFTNVPVDDPVFVRYAGLDALTARRLVPLLTSAAGNPAHVVTTDRWLSGQALELERTGCLVDRDRLEEISTDAQVREDQAAEVVAEHTGGLKTTQGVKLQAWLADHGVDWSTWPRTMRTPKDGPSLAKANVYNLRNYPLDEPGQAVVEAMITHGGLIDKLKRTAEVRAAMDSRGVVHPTLYTVGTVTSRMAAGGPNMQNFSKKDPAMRGLFVFRPGYVGLSCDFAQVEMRVMAAMAHEQSMIKTIIEGGDLHSLTAELLGITRQQAKTVNFLIGYGGGGPRLASQLQHTITEAEGTAIVRDYWKQYPAIAELNEWCKAQTGHIRLISGRRVPVGTAPWSVMNYLVQGSSRELLVGAWRRLIHECRRRGYDARVWFPIHDELVIEVREDQAEAVASLAGACMTFELYGVPIEAEADIMIDPQGISRWTTGDQAKVWEQARAA